MSAASSSSVWPPVVSALCREAAGRVLFVWSFGVPLPVRLLVRRSVVGLSNGNDIDMIDGHFSDSGRGRSGGSVVQLRACSGGCVAVIGARRAREPLARQAVLSGGSAMGFSDGGSAMGERCGGAAAAWWDRRWRRGERRRPDRRVMARQLGSVRRLGSVRWQWRPRRQRGLARHVRLGSARLGGGGGGTARLGSAQPGTAQRPARQHGTAWRSGSARLGGGSGGGSARRGAARRRARPR